MSHSRVTFVMYSLVLVTLLMARAGRAQVATNFYSFRSVVGGLEPEYVDLAQDRSGRIVGTTELSWEGNGVVFRLFPSGAGSQIYEFEGFSSGAFPNGGVMLATDGNLYGTATSGGSANGGVLFRITPSGEYAVVYNFGDNSFPYSPPIEASDGNLYGVTSGIGGGSYVYRYTRAGTFSVIYSLDVIHGSFAWLPPLQAADGNLYVTASQGGTYSCGAILKMTTSGIYLASYSFPCGAAGNYPVGSLIQASDGNFYGTTLAATVTIGGSSYDTGSIFKITQAGAVTTLHNFQLDGIDGNSPDTSLVEGSDGYLYGTTQLGGLTNAGTIFRISKPGAYSQVYSFTQDVGRFVRGSIMQHTNGKFYGTTIYGGAHDYGAVYSLDMGLGPFVTFVRATGKIGQTVQILSQNLTGATSVTFNGIPATSFNVVSDTYLTAVVPTGATTGKVVVTTPNGALTSNQNFRISN